MLWFYWMKTMLETPPVLRLEDLPYAYGKPLGTALIRSQPEDFIVEEIAGFEPSGEGDHVFLTLRKTGLTTQAVVGLLKQFTGVKDREIGFAGIKDRHAVTTQTFSINMTGQPIPDWSLLASEQLQVIDIQRHNRKLKRGVLKGNRFVLTLRDLQADSSELERRLQAIAQHGVPNYFGQQRFGRDGDNPENAWRMLTDRTFRVRRDERSILLSSIRSMLFNAVLATRIENHNWQSLIDGEVINLDGTERHFQEPVDDVLRHRALALDVHATGPMPGKASRAIEPDQLAGELERQALRPYREWIEALEKAGLDHARRPLRLAVKDLTWQISADQLRVSFRLTSGAYATSVLRELVEVKEGFQRT